MIARLIDWCIANRLLVVLLTACLIGAGIWSAQHITVDAIPDLSDVQVVIRTEYPGQAPQIVEDQVTYPLTTAMLAVPLAKVVRGYSMFGSSFVYIIFEDGTDMYWARSRVLEQLSSVSARLPEGVSPQLGPDATGVGWAYEYVLVTGRYCPEHPQGLWHDPVEDVWYAEPDDAPAEARERLERARTFDGMEECPLDGAPLAEPEVDLAGLRSLQDWYLRFELTAVEGVSEVAPVGGFVKQYQVVVDPVRLLAFDVPLSRVKQAIQGSNVDVGGRLIEMSETEYMVRGLGYLGTLSAEERAGIESRGESVEAVRTQRVLDELGGIALASSPQGRPVYLRDVAEVRLGPEIRRGIAEWNGQGEAVGGIVVMRFGQNASETIERVKAKLAELERGLPPGVAVRVGYDRSDLIDRAVRTLQHTLVEEIIVVGLVCILFLLHARSELVAVFVVPTGVLASIVLMYILGIDANIMSLGGIAIAIGVMVDSSIVMVENAHKHLDREEERLHEAAAAGEPAEPRDRRLIIAEAAREVGPSLFFSLLIITVSFLPIFVLGEQSGRMFKPLAWTKTFAMGSASLLAVTIIPVLMTYFITPRVLPKQWGMWRNAAITLAAMFIPAAILWTAPLGAWEVYRLWLAIGWIVFMGMLLVPQKIIHERANPISWILQGVYHPLFVLVMRFRWIVLLAAALLVASTAVPLLGFQRLFGDEAAQRFPALTQAFPGLGSEFMPPLEEGDLLYMPTTDPGISMGKARELLQQTDKLIMQIPEVVSVMGKVGRADTATDPAPPSMIETTITLERDKTQWRHVPVTFEHWPRGTRWLGRWLFGEARPITTAELVYGYVLPDGAHVQGLNDVVQIPGLTNSWTMPIKTRIDMLSTGIKTPVGVKVMGPDLGTLARLADEIATVIKTAEGTGQYTTSAFPEKSVGGNYFDIVINRDAIARYGMLVADVQDVIMTALGGMKLGSTVEGLQRYPINVRYPHELRDNIDALKQTLVATPGGAQIPLGQLADFVIHKGPPMIKSENARLTSWVFVDIAGIDVGTYVRNAQQAVARQVALPSGYSIVWSGQYEYMQAARARLMIVVPVAGVLIVLLLYLATHSWLRVGIVLLAVPFSLVGAVWLLYLLDYNLSLAVWVGVIALAGLDAETGLVMLLYLDNSFERFTQQGRMRNADDLWWAIHDGAVQRIRPKTMTVMTTFIGLVPLLWATGAGADTMRRLAAPMIGGLATSFLLELLIYPPLFYLAKRIALHRQFHENRAAPR
ncbi:MAG: efflux RND transporter permease subunit [Phycisphaerales bacterium]|nr:efflux RND transporter permease subunit [Phycisphaerales bacterium]